MRRYYYIDKKDTNKVLEEITKAQVKANCFVNVSVKPYNGKKYNKENTVVVTVG